MDFPIENGGSFHSYVKVYQRVALENPLEMEVLMILMGTSSIFFWGPSIAWLC